MKNFLCLLALVSTISLVAQKEPEKKKMPRFLPDYKSYSLVNFGLGLNTDLPTTITKGAVGGSLEIGVNLAKPFSKYVLAAPYVGVSISSVKNYRSAFRRHLVNSFAGFPEEYTDIANSSLSYLSSEERGLVESYEQAADEFNNITNNNVTRKVTFSYGIMLKLPSRVLPLVKLYRSFHHISGTIVKQPVGIIKHELGDFDPFPKTAGKIDIKGFGFEVDLFTSWFANTFQHKDNVRLGQISIYSEWYDLKSLHLGNKLNYHSFSIERKSITSFLNESNTFSSAYNKEVRVGFKIGISIL